MELLVEVHVELHMEPHVEVHVGLHMELNMEPIWSSTWSPYGPQYGAPFGAPHGASRQNDFYNSTVSEEQLVANRECLWQRNARSCRRSSKLQHYILASIQAYGIYRAP